MDFYVVLKRPGSRVAKRKAKKGRVGLKQLMKKDDAMNWFKQKYDGIILQ
jgi:large subunit ribosomal protein L11e